MINIYQIYMYISLLLMQFILVDKLCVCMREGGL